jgi:hypothetical protein
MILHAFFNSQFPKGSLFRHKDRELIQSRKKQTPQVFNYAGYTLFIPVCFPLTQCTSPYSNLEAVLPALRPYNLKPLQK